MLGKPGMGLQIALTALDSGRIGIASQATGMLSACLHEGVSYAMARRQFGKPIIKHQSIQNMIADIAVDHEAASLLVWSAASLKDAKKPFTREASIAKLAATESLKPVRLQGPADFRRLRIHSGQQDRTHLPRRAGTTIYEGTSEIQRMIIARETESGMSV